MSKIIVITGPTGSGKTFFALSLAKKYGAAIVNADSMQIYKGLEVLTASPTDEIKKQAPHFLYNFLEIDKNFSAANYALKASGLIKKKLENNQTIILVGGSGLYIKTLLYGHSPIPDIEPSVRESAREEFARYDIDQIREKIEKLNLLTFHKDSKASIISSLDRQRATRIYEIYLATGKSIEYFWNQKSKQYISCDNIKIITLLPEKEFLHNSCKKRLEDAFKNSAIDEVQNILKSGVFPAKKIIGFSEIQQYLQGAITIEQALEEAFIKTRQYAKRQATWFRHQIKADDVIYYSSAKEFESKILDL